MIKDKVNALFSAIKAVFSEMKSVSTDKGMLYYDGELTVGTAVYTEGGIVESGIFVTDSKVITVSNGVVLSIEDIPVEEVSFGSVPTDKAVLSFEGDELKSGMAVYVDGKSAPDGDYITEDGKTIKVVGGIVESIVDPVAEVEALESFAEEVKEEPKEEVKEEPKNEVEVEYIPKEAFESEVAKINEAITGMQDAFNEFRERCTALESRMKDIEGAPEGGLPKDEFKKMTKSVEDFGTGIEAIKAMKASMRIK